ncbi:MAG: CBS domain-containing protein [Thermoflexales bacterium]|nr:CBS domain-containing protein [Thermoflexales bacterium]
MTEETTLTERRLVRDLMTVGVPTCPPTTLLVDLVRLMLEKNWEAVVVLDGDEGHAIGIVSHDEIIKAYERDDARTLTVEQMMHEGVPQVPPDIPLPVAAQMMLDQRVRAFFLMHNAGGITYPAAMITYRHLMRHLAAQSDDDLKDMGIAAARKAPLQQFIERRDAAKRAADSRKK